jgi:5'-deoxynucleotidase YfbR-like HD superfamily hydrolase
MGMMSMIASDAGVDQTRCIKMSIVHDVAESIVGDITPHCKVFVCEFLHTCPACCPSSSLVPGKGE